MPADYITPPRPVALITGGTSGIGLELAKQFADHHYDLILVARAPGPLAEAKAFFEERDVRVETISADLSKRNAAQGVFEKVKTLGWDVDVLVNNAGAGVYGDFVMETNLQEELDIIQLNIASVVELTKYFTKDMIGRKGGKILFTASMAGIVPSPFLTVYSATKSFVLSFAEALRDELKGSGITVTALCPGATDTKFFERADMVHKKEKLGKLADPKDIAEAGFNALMKGDDHVVAPFKDSLMTNFMNKFLPMDAAVHAARIQ